MRKLDLVEFLSLDGVMQGLAGPDGDFPHPGWGLNYPVAPEEDPDSRTFAGTTGYLFGRRTYEEMQAFWPHQPDDNPMAASLNHTPKYVVSSTITNATWEPTTVISGDVARSVEALKTDGEGAIVVLGSGQLARFLLAAGLVDGLTLFIHPLLLGTGTRLFGDLPDLQPLHLESSRTSEHGSLVLNYTVGHA
ncbi:MAG TPA: dihydrofolate reductase family protein [Propionicimonas sp.]|jgi:dihydrofolate reductase|uniref:dihydrofolate reductase family protein n=1 Tax=Propionicimonas sp. TaxID=1955623 RepID=UPI002F415FFE